MGPVNYTARFRREPPCALPLVLSQFSHSASNLNWPYYR